MLKSHVTMSGKVGHLHGREEVTVAGICGTRTIATGKTVITGEILSVKQTITDQRTGKTVTETSWRPSIGFSKQLGGGTKLIA